MELGVWILSWAVGGVWDFLVVICNCGVGVRVRRDDNGDIYIQGRILECVPDWFHKVGKVCVVRRDIDLLEGPRGSGLCGGRIFWASAGVSIVKSSGPGDVVV